MQYCGEHLFGAMSVAEMRAFVAEQPVMAAAVAVAAVLLSPVLVMTTGPLVLAGVGAVAPVLLPAAVLALVSRSAAPAGVGRAPSTPCMPLIADTRLPPAGTAPTRRSR